MSFKRPALLALRWCGSCAALLLCWAVWLALAALLALQLWIASHRELALPDFALRAVENRLAASQVTARFGRAMFDPTGRVLLQDVRLFSPDQPTPLVTIRAAYARVDFWALLVGDLRLDEIRVTGVDLHLPAMLSPSGADEAVVSDLDGVFHIGRSNYAIDLCTFRLAGIDVTAAGGFHLPATIRAHPGSLPLLDLVLQRYLQAGRKLETLQPQLDALDQPLLQLTFTPSDDRGALVEARLFVRAFHPPGPYRIADASARAAFPLLGDQPVATQVRVEAERGTWAGQGAARQLRLELAGALAPDRFAFTPRALRLTAAGGEAHGVAFGPLFADVAPAPFPRVRGEVGAQVGGAAQTAQIDLDAKSGAGTVTVTGTLTPALLRRAADLPGLAAARWVALQDPVTAEGRLELAGWKPLRAEGDAAAGRLIAHEVPLDAVSAHVAYGGRDLRVTELILRQGGNLARGSYMMDTATRDYRFLLQGRLRPLDISGWFKEWWPRFWENFDFTAAPPVADVDVTGRWKAPERSAVFCHVDADHPGIRGVAFDRVRTTLFVRPFFYDVFAFRAEHAGRAAHGAFVLTVEPHQAKYRTLDFAGESDLDPADGARLYGPAGAAYVAPYQYAVPPHVRATGHLVGPEAPGGPQTKFDLALTTDTRFAFEGLPLDHLQFDARYDNGTLQLRQVAAGFAGGTLTGTARLDGPPEARRLAFDAAVKGADLARAINALEGVQLPGAPAGTKHVGPRFLRRATGGHLDLTLSAEGRYRQSYSFQGAGQLAISGQELGEINLFGPLSELLSKTLLNFTSLRLDAAQANFKVEGRKLAFSAVKLTGPTAAIDAKGDYWLDAKTLDFTAVVFPLHKSSFVPADALGVLLTPLSSLLELKLTGSLEKPSWTFLFGPVNILRSIVRPPPGAPPAPAAPPTPAPSTPTPSPTPP